MDLIAIHPNSYKHGLDDNAIEHAWRNAFEWLRRDGDDGKQSTFSSASTTKDVLWSLSRGLSGTTAISCSTPIPLLRAGCWKSLGSWGNKEVNAWIGKPWKS